MPRPTPVSRSATNWLLPPIDDYKRSFVVLLGRRRFCVIDPPYHSVLVATRATHRRRLLINKAHKIIPAQRKRTS